MPFPIFDRSRLRIQPLALRQNDLNLSVLPPLEAAPPAYDPPAPPTLGRRLVEAKRQGRARILLMGAVADGGESFYLQGDHRANVPHLRRAALAAEGETP